MTTKHKSRTSKKLHMERLENRLLLAYVKTGEIPEFDGPPVNITPAEFTAAVERAAAEVRDVPLAMQGKANAGFWNGLKELEALVMDRFVFHHSGLPLSQVELQRAQRAQLNDVGEVLI